MRAQGSRGGPRNPIRAITASVALFATVATMVGAAPVTASAAARPAVTSASVERTDTGQLKISWTTQKGVRVTSIRWGTTPERTNQTLVASVPKGEHEVVVDDPSPGSRPYVELVASNGAHRIVAERRVLLEGDPNFRDLGGYTTTDGRTVRWGRVYRSGSLDTLTDADLTKLDGLGIKLVCDLRAPSEIAVEPDRVPGGAETLRVPIADDSVDPEVVKKQVLAGDVSSLGAPGELLTDGNRKFVTDFKDEYAKIMQRVMDPKYQPTLVHCSAGKDRAGLAAAIVLLTLGVPEKTVMQDYLLSNQYRAAENARAITSVSALLDPAGVEVVRSLVEVRPEYLQAALDMMVKKYGSIDGYIRKGLGITDKERARFKKQMLESS
jgi:protein-tyrosine phosphatase